MGRGKSVHTLKLIEAAHRILEEIHPASVRAVCYRLFTEGLIDSMSKSNTNSVGRQLVYGREHGIIPWNWIVDETRGVEGNVGFENPEEFKRAALHSFRRDHWKYQKVRVEVWSEKGTVRGTLKPVLDEFGVAFRVMHGYSSATTVYEIARSVFNDSKPWIALYCGDWDPSGLHMSEVDLPYRLQDYGWSEEKGWPDINIIRIALTQEDTNSDLPSFDVITKHRDPRCRWYLEKYQTRRAWELDALNPTELRDRFRWAISNQIDKAAWERCSAAEAAEQASLEQVLGRWSSIHGQANG